MKQLTAERLRQVILYDPHLGTFVWKIRMANRHVGSIAGTVRKDSRRQIRIDGKLYLGSRLAWLFMTGEWPVWDIDHRDRNKANDIFSNLRDATHGKNMANRAKWTGTSKFLGVHKKRNRWKSSICSAGKSLRLGSFKTQEEAAAAYDEAAAKIHGQFAVLNRVKD